jgi:hypothetical protein
MSQMTDYRENELIKGLYRTSTILTRANTTAYNAGDRIVLTTFDGNFYECTTGGTSAGSPPTFNTNIGDSTTDGSVVWLTLKPGVPKRPKYLALYTAAPGETGGGTEVTGGSYARVAVPPADANWAAPSGGNGVTSNVNAATFPAPTANWGVVTHTAEVDRSAAGNIEMYGALTTPKTINNGDAAPSFASSAFAVTFA